MLLLVLVCPSLTVDAKQISNKESAVKTVVIDPGCQETANDKKEPVGPGSFSTTAESDANTFGSETSYPEYEMNLQIAKKVEGILTDQGYNVLLTRDSNDVNMSNSSRAMIANTADADIFVVIKGSENAGMSVVCQTPDNPYNYGNYSDGRLLSDAIMGSVKQATACNADDVVESDDKAAINWCAAPTAIVEVGSLEEPDEEAKLITDEYQQEVAQGIANGIDSYFTQK